jgi:hypothetical protein
MTLSVSSFRSGLQWAAGLWILTLLALLTGCDSTATDPAATTDEATPPPAVAEVLPGDLQLTAAQSATLSTRFGEADTLRAGDLWRLAADLQDTLTEEQLRRLTSVTSPPPSMRDRRQMRRALRTTLQDELSAEQRAEIRSLWTEHRETVSQLREDLEMGTLSQDGFFDRLQSHRQALREDIRAVLPPDHRARLDALREKVSQFRPEHKQARQEALNLTSSQQEELRALLETTLLSVQSIVGDVREGDIDRSETREALRPIREEARSAAQDILSDEQWELAQVYRGLLVTARQSSERRGILRRLRSILDG